MRYPHDRFLTFLFTKKADSRKVLRRLGLPPTGELFFTDLEARLEESVPSSVWSYIIHPDGVKRGAPRNLHRSLEKLGIAELWDSDKPEADSENILAAYKCFAGWQTRGVLGGLLLTKWPSEEVLQIFNQRFDRELTEAQLDLYRRTFFDVSGWELRALRNYVELLPEEREAQFLLAGLSGKPKGELLITFGVTPTIKHNDILNDIAQNSYQQYRKATRSSNPDSMDVFKWAELTLKAINMHKTVAPPTDEQEMASRFDGMFSVKYEEVRIPSLDELTRADLDEQTSAEEGA